ncbi:MAG: rhomboid family intramembrane serine protease [Crocinitomicaceae bacterium]|nr:rhomboid family intramembrane serine protease [Crocinitomicaceae bacterium]
MSRKHQETHSFTEIELQRAIIISIETFLQNDWLVEGISNSTITGFASRDSITEKITVSIGVNSLTISSESSEDTEILKHKQNVIAFIKAFEMVKSSITESRIKQHQGVIDEYNLRVKQTKHINGKLERKSFKPSKDFIVTPIIVGINVFVFILMVLSGVDFNSPETLDIIKWGGDVRYLTANGEWWRLITSCFVHIGFFHLLMNMYFLLYIGTYLEPILGRWKFTMVYLLTGILASLTSICWDGVNVSAGASGAIFGIFGLFIALLTTNLIPKHTRLPLLKNLGFILIINLIFGISAGVDNAAHIGGLISGILIGYSLYPILNRENSTYLGKNIIISFSIITLALCYFCLSQLSSDDIKFSNDLRKFGELEDKAFDAYRDIPNIFDVPKENLVAISLPKWKACRKIIQHSFTYNLSRELKKKRTDFFEYTRLRINMDSLLILQTEDRDSINELKIIQFHDQLTEVIKSIKSEVQ